MKEKLTRAEVQLDKTNIKVQKLKLKNQNVQGELIEIQKQNETQNEVVRQLQAINQALELKNQQLNDLMQQNKTKWA